MAKNWRSHIITSGVARSPNRAMLRAVGFKDGDFDKPIVGVANGHSTMNPCNAGIQPLVNRAIVALERSPDRIRLQISRPWERFISPSVELKNLGDTTNYQLHYRVNLPTVDSFPVLIKDRSIRLPLGFSLVSQS